MKASKVKYYQENKECVKERARQYYEENKEAKTEYQRNYCETHKAEINERARKYRSRNREQIMKHAYEQIECECGASFMRQNKLRHERTNKHKDYLKSLEQVD